MLRAAEIAAEALQNVKGDVEAEYDLEALTGVPVDTLIEFYQHKAEQPVGPRPRPERKAVPVGPLTPITVAEEARPAPEGDTDAAGRGEVLREEDLRRPDLPAPAPREGDGGETPPVG